MRARLGHLARQELADARDWYSQVSPALGRRFSGEVRAAVARIERNPMAFPVEIGDVRKCVLSVFPYTLRFAMRDDAILILTVSHQRRQPDYWTDRLPNP